MGATYVPFESTTTPLPAALPLFGAGLGGLGLLGWRRKRKVAVSTTKKVTKVLTARLAAVE